MLEPEDRDAALAREDPGGHGRASADHPRLVRLPGGGGIEPGRDEHGVAVAADDDRAAGALERQAPQRLLRLAEPALEDDVPRAEDDDRARGDCGDRGDDAEPA